MSEKPIIETLEKNCDSCPAQWVGTLDNGEHLYIRYRWGVLTMGHDADFNKAVLENKVRLELGGNFHGTMDTSTMIKHLSPYLEFEGLG